MLRELEDSLAENLESILSGQSTAIGGPKAVAEILNCTGLSTERAVLERMDSADPELAEMIRNQMFVFDDIAGLTDREIQTVLREVEQKDIVIALKAASDEVKDKFLDNMSERIRGFIEEEMDFAGPMRLSEVEEVQLRIVQKIRQLEDQGQIDNIRGSADDKFV